jgi:hypothetical protein
MAYVVYFIARLVFLMTNYSFYEGHLAFPHLMEMLGGGLVFDTAAILVTNSLYIVILLLTPWRRLAQWVYVVINAVALAVNLADCVYFRFTMRRTTTTVFNEFQNENNLAGVIGTEMVNHWYLVLLFIILVYAMWKLYRSPGKAVPVGKWWVWYPSQVLLLAACAPFVVAGIRGGFTTAVRPITISNANQYVDRPIEAALVLNTPFSIYRTIGKDVFVVPNYFSDEKTLASIYTPIHTPNDSLAGANSSLYTLHSSFKKVAAILISIITISGLAFAAIHFVRNHEGKPAETEQPAATVEARTADAGKQPADSTVSTQPVVFDNVTLDSILPQIARHYGYTVDFRNEQPKSLRLFFTWNPQDSIQKVTEKMNLFEQFHIVLEEQTIIIE